MFRFIVILFIAFSTYLPSSGQVAPDFTFTDIDGTVHNLQHALDQNYIILLEFFFSDCGPCITAATELQDIHEDYADKNVLVWAISDIDDDARILQFHEEMGLEYISGGVEGGGLEVFNSFTSINNFVAYPTIAVICPNSELTWDIYPYSLGAPEWRTAIEKCGVETVEAYEPYGSLTADIDRFSKEKIVTSIAPNPASDFVKIILENVDDWAEMEVNIYNAVGQFVKKIKQSPSRSRQQEMVISVKDLERGVYFLEMKVDGEKKEVLKLVVE